MRIIAAIAVVIISLALTQCAAKLSSERLSSAEQADGSAQFDSERNARVQDYDAYQVGGMSGSEAELKTGFSDQSTSDETDISGGTSPEEPGGEPSSENSASGGTTTEPNVHNDELLPDGWPYYIPIMGEYEIRFSGADKNGMHVVAYGKESVEAVKTFYENLGGWTMAGEDPMNSGISPQELGSFLITFVMLRNDEILTIGIFQDEDGSGFQLLYRKP